MPQTRQHGIQQTKTGENLMQKYQLCHQYKDGISFNNIAERHQHMCKGALHELAYDLLMAKINYDVKVYLPTILEIANSSDKIQWLINNNFIMPVQQTYQIGQIFEYKQTEHTITKWILSQAGLHSAALVGLHHGKWYIEPVYVEEINAITKIEFKQICGNFQKLFTEIKNEYT